ncbi:unnamed protein product [Peronospora belbahrii]|uniref:RING-type domain-containing protein n=1 Tax=Peronospora belbahrii TaxID=622444 RepID=A0ABN8CQK7_9STRA|nr:unnamed protein product [Peronospora belbahrii]
MVKQVMQAKRKAKHFQQVHSTIVRVNSVSMQRRLRKMCWKFQPSNFSFMVQARLLCVGMSVVYRLSLSLTITSTCLSKTSSSSTTLSGGHTTQSLWIIAISQTKFHRFYAQVNAILHHPIVAQFLVLPKDIQQMQLEDHDTAVEWEPFKVFLQILAENFQRYEHLHDAAFSIQADVNTMHAGKTDLEVFLSNCWKSLEVIVPVLVVEPYLPTPLGLEVLSIYLLMRDFLSLPKSVLDANCMYADAILSLEDVEDLLPARAEYPCSICLEPLTSSKMKGLVLPETNYDYNSGNNNGSGHYIDNESTVPSVDGLTFPVRLPCAHVFHENCAMSWLRYNPSCPECRAPVGMHLQ